MHYKPPKFDNKYQWVPIVVRNRDWLIGYVSGIKMIESLIVNSLENNGIELNLRGLDLCLDSSRFNDIMENGKKESNCTNEEIKQYYQDIIDEKINMVKEDHPDNNTEIFENSFLEVECICGLGIFSFKNPEEIPEESFKCQVCGRTIIDYTNHDDNEFEYDGNLKHKVDLIVENLRNKFEEEFDDDEEDENNF